MNNSSNIQHALEQIRADRLRLEQELRAPSHDTRNMIVSACLGAAVALASAAIGYAVFF